VLPSIVDSIGNNWEEEDHSCRKKKKKVTVGKVQGAVIPQDRRRGVGCHAAQGERWSKQGGGSEPGFLQGCVWPPPEEAVWAEKKSSHLAAGPNGGIDLEGKTGKGPGQGLVVQQNFKGEGVGWDNRRGGGKKNRGIGGEGGCGQKKGREIKLNGFV